MHFFFPSPPPFVSLLFPLAMPPRQGRAFRIGGLNKLLATSSSFPSIPFLLSPTRRSKPIRLSVSLFSDDFYFHGKSCELEWRGFWKDTRDCRGWDLGGMTRTTWLVMDTTPLPDSGRAPLFPARRSGLPFSESSKTPFKERHFHAGWNRAASYRGGRRNAGEEFNIIPCFHLLPWGGKDERGKKIGQKFPFFRHPLPPSPAKPR